MVSNLIHISWYMAYFPTKKSYQMNTEQHVIKKLKIIDCAKTAYEINRPQVSYSFSETFEFLWSRKVLSLLHWKNCEIVLFTEPVLTIISSSQLR